MEKQSLDGDKWINDPFLGNPAKLHAIGVITVLWGECENRLADLFSAVTGLNIAAARIICVEIGSITLQEKISLLAEETELSERNKELLTHTLNFFDIC